MQSCSVVPILVIVAAVIGGCTLSTGSLDTSSGSSDGSSSSPGSGTVSASGFESTGPLDGTTSSGGYTSSGTPSLDVGSTPLLDVGGSSSCAGAALIDDLEDGDRFIVAYPEEPRQGAWFTFNDGSEGVQTPAPDDTFVPSAGGFEGSTNAARTSGSGFTTWGVGIGLNLDDDEPDLPQSEPYDASAWQGVAFVARSNGDTIPVDVRFPTVAETPLDEGGTCESADGPCSDSHLQRLVFTSEWQRFELRFDDLAQGGWGQAFPFDPSQLLGVQWQVGIDLDFDIAIDDICFF